MRSTAAAPGTSSKDQRITVRVSAAQRELLTTASRSADTTLTEFILGAATARAEDVLADRQRFLLTASRYEAFVAMLDRPVVDRPRLRRLLAEGSAFEER